MQAWEKFLIQQEKELGTDTVKKWLRSLDVVRFDAGNLYLQANDSFQILWFKEHMHAKVQTGLFNNNNRRIKVHLSLKSAPIAKKNNRRFKTPTAPETPSALQISFDLLDPSYTFAHFAPLPEHLLAYKLLLNIAEPFPEQDGESLSFNPIYLFGPPGSGKTHLLMATAQALTAKEKSVIYVKADTFTDHVVAAIRMGDMEFFRRSYRHADTLIIDDVHLFAKKWATQEELFHTFNALHLMRKQMILSASCAPGELPFIEPRLVSRFEWGIVLSLPSPEPSDLRHILDAKSTALQFPLNGRVVEFLLNTFKRNTKTLCRALEALILRTHLHPTGKRISSTQLTVPFVEQQLQDLIHEELHNALTPSKIIQKVSEQFGIPKDDILGKGQKRECALPRQIAMYLCRTQLSMPFKQIGTVFTKDHSTVMSSVKAIQKAIDSNQTEIAANLQHLYRMLK